MKICQVVGYKNSGKTTVMKQLIRYLASQHVRVGSLKHHGHGGEPKTAEQTDSYQQFEMGALISGVQGENRTQLMLQNLELDELIQVYAMLQLDILFIEGFKRADFPKVVLIKNDAELPLLNELSNIIAVGSWDLGILQHVKDFPIFGIRNMEIYLAELVERIKGC